MHEPTHIDLCAGFGGFSIAAEWAGFKTIGFAEIAEYPSRVLASKYPSAPNWGDIRNTPAIQCNLVTCGDPCPPFSIAGRRLGEADPRYLWPSVLDAIGRHDPDWCVLENVVGSKNMVLSRRFDDLAERGYQSQAFDLPSCGVGLPSVERHIWLVAAAMRLRLEGNSQARAPWYKVEERDRWSIRDGVARVAELGHLPEPKLLRSRKGVPYFRERITGLGNAVPPPVAFQILSTIRAVMTRCNI